MSAPATRKLYFGDKVENMRKNATAAGAAELMVKTELHRSSELIRPIRPHRHHVPFKQPFIVPLWAGMESANRMCIVIPDDAFPHQLSEPYVTALRMALDFILSRPDRPLAVTVSGSVVQGHGDPFSDLDLWTVVEGVHRQRVQRRFNGVPCEMFFNPESRIPAYFEEESREGRASSIGLTLDGHVLYDPEGVAERLQEQAAQVRSAGPQVPHETVVLRRYLAVDTLDNARDIHARDPLMSSLLTADAIKSALQLSYVLAGMWTPRDKDLSLRLSEACPQAVEPLRSYRRQPTPNTAESVLDAILNESTFFEWESAPDSG